MKVKPKSNSQLIHEELWNVVRSINNKTLSPEEAESITNAVGKMIGLALLEIKSKEMGISNPLDKVKMTDIRKEAEKQKALK